MTNILHLFLINSLNLETNEKIQGVKTKKHLYKVNKRMSANNSKF